MFGFTTRQVTCVAPPDCRATLVISIFRPTVVVLVPLQPASKTAKTRRTQSGVGNDFIGRIVRAEGDAASLLVLALGFLFRATASEFQLRNHPDDRQDQDRGK